jgi:hypothetical protein
MKITVCEFPDEAAGFEPAWDSLKETLEAEPTDFLLLPEFAAAESFWSSPRFDLAIWHETVAKHAQLSKQLERLSARRIVGTRAVETNQRRLNESFLWTATRVPAPSINSLLAHKTHQRAQPIGSTNIGWPKNHKESHLPSDGNVEFAKRFRLFGDEQWSNSWRAIGVAARLPSRVIDPSMCWSGIGSAICDRQGGFYAPGPETASGSASINVQAQRDAVTLKYQCGSYGEDWNDVDQRVPIVWTPCRFGGERPWFVCSVASNGVYCGRSVTMLYSAGRLFACRHCYQLAYASQQEPARLRGFKKITKDSNAAGRKRKRA